MDRIGRFRISKELGRGAMGVVYQAIDPTIGRPVAIKTVRLREVDDDGERSRLRERLFREARAAGVLSHPGIVTIYDMDEEDGLAYIAMQLVNGPTVESLLNSARPLTPEQIFRILRQTASALDFAHSKGIVHRDIKPANIMIDEDGTVKIADFGIAKASANGKLTASGTILGTPNYMSPEQVQGSRTDGRSDQFSLGVVAYEILTGERPFSGENLGTVVYRIVAEQAAAPARVNPALGERIGEVLQRALEKNPKRRFISCTEFVSSLEAACAETPGWHLLSTGSSPKAAVELATASQGIRSKFRRSGSPAAILVTQESGKLGVPGSLASPAIGAFVIVLAILGLVAWQTGTGSKRTNVSQPGTETLKRPIDDLETPPPTVKVQSPPAPEEQTEAPLKTEEADAAPVVVNAPAGPAPGPPLRNRSLAKVAAVPAIFTKRSPFGGSTTLPVSITTPIPPPEIALQDIWAVTAPSGATAILDGHTESACQTPCMLLGEPGLHLLSLSLANFQPERRQLRVADSREDVPPVVMRPVGGTLMVSTIPSGANIFLDDRMLTQMTPAQVILQPGVYQISVERDGTRKTQEITVRNGSTNYLRIPMED